MQYRNLGRTGVKVSAVSLGCNGIGSSNTEYALKVVRKALELGVNYIDTARSYWDTETKLGIALKGKRDTVFLSSKTDGITKDDALREIKESLERLKTDYLDNCHIHGLKKGEDIEKRLSLGGALEGLIEARDKGLIRYIGCTSHRSDVLIEALKRFDFDVILVPMNMVEQEPLRELIPLCVSRGVGVTIMKPLATGLLPVKLALKWLINQPISTAVPGITTLKEAEEDLMVNYMEDISITSEEKQQIEQITEHLDHLRCRICYECEPCPQGIPISLLLGTEVIYDHYRTMGVEKFKQFPWSQERIRNHIGPLKQTISQIRSCTKCKICEERCPHNLSVVSMLQNMLEPEEDILRILNKLLPYTSL
jgi:predicted aldo/keto reductase-like oxidoreductase